MTPVSRGLALGLLFLLVAGAAVTALITGADGLGPVIEQTAVAALLGGLGLAAGLRWAVHELVVPLIVVAVLATAVLFLTPAGRVEYGALRNLHVGVTLQPAALWLIAAQFAAAAVAVSVGQTPGHRRPSVAAMLVRLAVTLAGAVGTAVAMPELSVLPPIAAGLVAVAWMSGRKRLALVPIALALLALALSPLLPYVRRRWIGWLDPNSDRLGVGFEYRALASTVARSVWFGSPPGAAPHLSSPASDYWIVSAMWRLGRVAVVGWVGALVAAVGAVVRLPGRFGMERTSQEALLAAAVGAGMLAALAVHAAYNLGLMPITAMPAPLVGGAGTYSGVQLFGLAFVLARVGRRA